MAEPIAMCWAYWSAFALDVHGGLGDPDKVPAPPTADAVADVIVADSDGVS